MPSSLISPVVDRNLHAPYEVQPMSKRKPTGPTKRRTHHARRERSEWVGGRLTLPFYIQEPEPFRPELVLWLELPDGLVVGHELIDPHGPPLSIGDTLRQAMASPLVGPARRPRRIRVSDQHSADALRLAVPDIPVVVAPTPELDALVGQMLGSAPEDKAPLSHFEQGRVGPEAVASLFEAAESLFRAAPWQLLQDNPVLRLDIDALEVEGACVSVIGALGESLGLIIFPSHVAMERFLANVDTSAPAQAPMDLGTTTLSLNFERGADLPPGLRREAAEHGWPVAGPDAYPWVQQRDRDGTLAPLNERDVRIVAACAHAVAALCTEHRTLLTETPEPTLDANHSGPGGIEVRLRMPYAAGESTASGEGPSSARPAADPARRASDLHDLDGRLVEAMIEFAKRRFDHAWLQGAKRIAERTKAIALLGPALAYLVRVDDKPVAHWYAREHARDLSQTEQGWLQAQLAGWLSVWEVRGVDPGRSLELADLLTGETRQVLEKNASRTLNVRHAILARVVDFAGLSLLCGVHDRPLPPREALDVVRHARRSLRRGGARGIKRLRQEKMARYLIARWEDAVAELDARPAPQLQLSNTDGEGLLITVDRFEFEPARQREIETALATIDGVDAPTAGEPDGCYRFIRPDPSDPTGAQGTILGHAWIGKGKLRVETHSRERADRIRAQIETGCGDRLRHRSREHSDPQALMDKERGDFNPSAPPAPPAPPGPEAEAAIRHYKQQHYTAWLDQRLPALDGQTPRAAVRTQAGREQVDLLLKEFESDEARLPEAQRYDFTQLRHTLGV